MKLKDLLLLILVIFLSFSSCSELDTTMLHGKWKGHQMLEHGKVIDTGAELASFEFDANGVYHYEIAHHKEAGHYRTLEDKLYTTDTIDSRRLEKVVRVALLTSDSLHIQMNKGGIDQLLKCFKEK